MKRIATTTGLYPLPDWAKSQLREQKGRQRDDLISGNEGEDVTATYDTAREEVIERQQAAELDRIVEGQLRWDDMLCHPLAVHDAVEAGGILRYYDNNNFYREMSVQGELTTTGDLATELNAAARIAPDDARQAVLPGPCSLADLATDEYYGDEDAFLDAVAGFLAEEVRSCPAVETTLLLEPSLAVDPPPEQAETIDAIETVAEAATGEVIVHTYWGTPSTGLYASLLDASVDGVGLDLVTSASDVGALGREYGYPDATAFGVVDGQNTRIETAEEIDRLLDDALTDADMPNRAYLTINTEAFYLPFGRFDRKLAALADAVTPEEVAP